MLSKIKFRGDLKKLSENEKGEINERLRSFEEKNKDFFREMHLNIDCKPHKEKTRGKQSYFCRINLDSDNGRFHADEQNFGASIAVNGALKKIERQILKE